MCFFSTVFVRHFTLPKVGNVSFFFFLTQIFHCLVLQQLFIHSFNKYLKSTCSVPGTILSPFIRNVNSFIVSFFPVGLSTLFLPLPLGAYPQCAFGDWWGETSFVNSLFKLDIFLAQAFTLRHKVILTIPHRCAMTNCPGFYFSESRRVIILWGDLC